MAGGWVRSPSGNPTVVTACSAHLATGPSLGPGCVVPVVITTTAPSDVRSTLHHFAGSLLIGFAAAGHRREATCGRRAGVETDISSSEDNLLTIPRPLRREVLGHPLQDQRCFPWPSPYRNGLGSSLFRPHGRTALATLQASLHAADWSVATAFMRCRRSASTAGSRPTPGASYRGPWRLPGPGLHRLAALSLSLGYVMSTSSSSWRPSCWTHS